MRVYLDNAATTQVAKEVVEAMQPYLTEKYGNASSLHQFGTEAKDALDDARQAVADSINADASEIIFTSSGTESNNIAIRGYAHKHKDIGRHLITSSIEHPSVLDTFRALKEEGFDVTYLGVDSEGFVDIDKLRSVLRKETTMVSVIHGNNEIGTIQNISEIGKICNDKSICFHTDAVQSFTKVPIDVKKMNINMLSISGHKIHGPKGIGALYVRANTKLHKIITGGHQESDIRPGTENVAGAVGFAKAVDLVKEVDIEKMTKLRDDLIKGVLKIEDCRLNGPKTRLCNNANFSFKDVEGESILLNLDEKGIAISTGSACTTQSKEPSHVLRAIGLKEEWLNGSVRMTLSRYNTKEEIDYVLKVLPGIIEQLRAVND